MQHELRLCWLPQDLWSVPWIDRVSLVTTIRPVPVFAAHIAETEHASVLMEHAPSAKLVTMDRSFI